MTTTAQNWDAARTVIGTGTLSILMPAHNLGPEIARNIREVRDAVAGQIPFELVVIDDGSTDDTGPQIESLRAEIPELRPVLLARNLGKGGALRQGFEACRGTHVLFLDADLDLPPRQIPTLFDVMASEKTDIVIGSKQHPLSQLHYPWFRRLTSTVYYWLVKAVFGLPVRDTQTGLKLFRRAPLEWAFPRMLVKAYAFDLELLTLAHLRGFTVAEAPVHLEFRARWKVIRPRMIRSILNDTLAVFYRLRILRYYQAIPDIRIPTPAPLVSVVIAFPAHSAYLEEALAGLWRQTYRRFEVLLLPDAATGRAWPEGVREIPTGRIRPAEKRNLGIREARGDVVAFLDDDAWPAPDWLERALGYFSIADVLAVGGPAVTPHNDPRMAQLSGRVYENWLVSGGYRYRYQPRRVLEVDDYPSCNLLVRTAALRQLNGFRTDFWPGEDTYLCMELVHRLRGRILYEPRALVYHHRRALFLPHLRQIGRYALHRGYFARRFPSTSRRIGYMIPSLFVVGLTGGAALSTLWPPLRPFYLAGMGLYLGLTLLFSASRNPLTWLITWLGVMLTHVVYGARFMAGLFTRRLPGEVERFDHPSEREVPSTRPDAGALS